MSQLYTRRMVKEAPIETTPIQTKMLRSPGGSAGDRTGRAWLRQILLLAIFAVSGGCGLGYETLWARYAGLFLGNTVLLHMTVLGAFMAGLSWGSFVVGARASRAARPLVWYACLELAVALYALALPHISGAERAALIHLGRSAGGITPLWIKLILAAAMLLPPTFFMGGTYPAMVAAWNCNQPNSRGAAPLYAANCAGAVGGVLVVGLILIPALGLAGTTWVLAGLSGLAGICALTLAVGLHPAALPTDYASAPSPRGFAGILAAIFCSGAAAFIYELVWTRLFALTLGSSTYSFTLMLAAFITGLALGSAAVAMMPGMRRAPLLGFAAAEAGIAAVVAVSIPLYQRMPYWFWVLRWQLRPVPDTVGIYHALQYLATLGVMLVPTLLFGITFPLAIAARSTGDPRTEEQASAEVYGWNTAGTLAGVLAAGLCFVPAFGLRTSLMIGVLFNLLAAVAVVGREAVPAKARGATVAASVAVVALLLLTPDWDPFAFAQGAYRYQTRPPASWQSFLNGLASHKIIFRTEDFGTTVSVVDGPTVGGIPDRLLVVDGKTDASAYGDLPTEILLGQAPLLLHPQARNVFVVGLGSGVTVGSVLTHPVARVDCAEVSQGVVQAERLFEPVNGWIRRDARLHLLLEDGRMALAAAPSRYDVIISEPPNPWIAGVGNLFSADFYRVAGEHLAEDGLFAQWFHAYEFNDHLAATLMATFRTAFPYAIIINGNTQDFILIGAKHPFRPDFPAMETSIRSPLVAADLERIRIRTLAAFLSRQTHGVEAVARLAAGANLNTEDRPVLEFVAPNAQYAGETAQALARSDERLHPQGHLLLHEYLRFHRLSKEDLASIIDNLLDEREGKPELACLALKAYVGRWPHDGSYTELLARVEGELGLYAQAYQHAIRAARLGDPTALAVAERARAHMDGDSVWTTVPRPLQTTPHVERGVSHEIVRP